MEHIYYILGAGLIISLISIIGFVLIKSHPKISTFINKNLGLFTALSAGVFLVTSFLLGKETLEILSLDTALISFSGGVILYFILHRILSPHRHQGENHSHDHDNKKAAWKVLIGDAIHNIADGLLLVASFGAGPTVGLSTAVSIILHETPQEISEFLVLKKSGYTDTEAMYRNFATALTIFIGIVIGLFLVQSETLQAYLLGITSTFFLGIVFTDLFPLKKIIKEKKLIPMSMALGIGIIFMLVINLLLGHSHSHEHNEHTYNIHHVDEHIIAR